MFIGHSKTDKKNIMEIIEKTGSKIYFIGIGGISMSALAELSILKGLRVFGSDRRKSNITENLKKKGAFITYLHGKGEIYRIMPTLVVYSLAIDENNPEIEAAKELNVPIISRAEYLGAFIEKYKYSIGISGSHGKSTVTAMLASIFSEAERLPTVIGGAEISDGTSFIPGERNTLIYEACEYGDSFLRFSPKISVMLNLDIDHTDYFKTKEQIQASFLQAANLAADVVVINADDENLSEIIEKINTRTILFSKNKDTEYKYIPIYKGNGKYKFELYHNGRLCGEFSLGTIGEFNVTNAVAATVTANYTGVSFDVVNKSLSNFKGIPRRMEFLGKHQGADVFYDYAHHPKEIRATREAFKLCGYNNICAIFAPHTYTRTKTFFKEFAEELSKFTKTYITNIYGAREAPIVGVTSSALSEKVREYGGDSTAIFLHDTVDFLKKSSFDCIVIMGAGDLEGVKELILKNKS